MKKSLMLFVFIALTAFANAVYAFSQSSAGSPQDMNFQEEMTSISGKVVETMDSGSYTYVNVEKDGKKTWVAVPQMKVTVGQNISFRPGAVMTDFVSKTLNRTFDAIIFSAGVSGQQAAAPAADHKKPNVSATKPVNVDKAAGGDAYTVAELYEKSVKLDKKSIVIKAQVVKFSANIMGKNWIHLQDGSGDSAKGTHDILVTSKDVVTVGDIVTAKGTLYRDKDFGSGYKYAVIVEEAGVNK